MRLGTPFLCADSPNCFNLNTGNTNPTDTNGKLTKTNANPTETNGKQTR